MFDSFYDSRRTSVTSASSVSSVSTVIRVDKFDPITTEESSTTSIPSLSNDIGDTELNTDALDQLTITSPEDDGVETSMPTQPWPAFNDANPRLDWFRADCDTLEDLTVVSRKRFKQASIWNDNGRGWARQWINLFARLHWQEHEDALEYARETTWADLEQISQEGRTKGVQRCMHILSCAGINDDLAISLWDTLVRHLADRDPDNDEAETDQSVPSMRLQRAFIDSLDAGTRPTLPPRRASYDVQMTDAHQANALEVGDRRKATSFCDLDWMKAHGLPVWEIDEEAETGKSASGLVVGAGNEISQPIGSFAGPKILAPAVAFEEKKPGATRHFDTLKVTARV